MKRLFCVVLFLIAGTLCAFSKEVVKNVAVFETCENLSSGEKAWLPETAREKIENNFKDYTKLQIVSLNDKQLIDMDDLKQVNLGNFSENDFIKTGEITGTSHGILLKVSRQNELYTVTAAFVNLSNGKIRAKCVSTGCSKLEQLTLNAGCAVDLVTLDLCDRLGIKLSEVQRYLLQGIEISESDTLKNYDQEILNYEDQIADKDSELASLSEKGGNNSAEVTKLELERSLIQEQLRATEAVKAGLMELERNRKSETEAKAQKLKDQFEKVSKAADYADERINDLKKLPAKNESALVRISNIETMKSTILDIQANVKKMQDLNETAIRGEYKTKIEGISNSSWRTAERNADGSPAPEALQIRSVNAETLRSECERSVEQSSERIAKATYESQAEILADIIMDREELESKTFCASTLNKTLSIKVGNYNRSTDSWAIHCTVISDGTEIAGFDGVINYADIEKVLPASDSKFDSVDMYDSLLKNGDPVLTYVLYYKVTSIEKEPSTYEFDFEKLTAYDTKNVKINDEGKVEGPCFFCASENSVKKTTNPVYDSYKTPFIEALAEKVIQNAETREAKLAALEAERNEKERLAAIEKQKADKAAAQKRLEANADKFVAVTMENGKELYFSSTETTMYFYEKSSGAQFVPQTNISILDIIVFCNNLSKKEGKEPCYAVKGKTDTSKWKVNKLTDSKKIMKFLSTLTCDTSKNGYRLPTLEEWQYAARAGEDYLFAGSDNAADVAWYKANSGGKASTVSQKKVNGNELYDMSGNVWEWCWNVDFKSNGTFYYAGGSYDSEESKCGINSVESGDASKKAGNIGFRLVTSSKK